MNNTLSTGLHVLEALIVGEMPLGVSELARCLGKDKGNVHRVLSTLSDHGLVYQDSATRKYALGPGWARGIGNRPTAHPGAHLMRRPDIAAWWAVDR
ncbi:MAG: kdgR [Polaromonas sp.]|jgi:IclR family acetate operon transcriptional repressor|nr:kdgR [Polaromonas sp.]